LRSTHRRKARLLGAADVDFVPYIVLLAFAGVRREELHKGFAWESIKLRARHDPGFCWNRENRAQAKDRLGSERFGLACALSREARPDLQSRSAQAHGESVRCVPCEIAAQRAPAQLRQLPPGANEKRRASRARDGNSAGIGMKHYVELVDAKAAREYWSIKPIRSTDRKIVAIA
jgi:hypothetical protein